MPECNLSFKGKDFQITSLTLLSVWSRFGIRKQVALSWESRGANFIEHPKENNLSMVCIRIYYLEKVRTEESQRSLDSKLTIYKMHIERQSFKPICKLKKDIFQKKKINVYLHFKVRLNIYFLHLIAKEIKRYRFNTQFTASIWSIISIRKHAWWII